MFGDIGKMMEMMTVFKKVKKELPALKEKLNSTEYTEQVAGGMVTATVNGKFQLVNIELSENTSDLSKEEIEDLIKAAVNAAHSKAGRATADAMKELTGGMDLGDLGGLL